MQNQALLEKLNAEENRRKSAEKSQVLFFLIIPEHASTTRERGSCSPYKDDLAHVKIHASSLTLVAFPQQRDSHTLYLEQELDSLKVVLDLKTQQLHQQEKKLMELEKLVR